MKDGLVGGNDTLCERKFYFLINNMIIFYNDRPLIKFILIHFNGFCFRVD